jgi:phospholipid/cholesterol/gamma-HCH transport system substrate-binding protein
MAFKISNEAKVGALTIIAVTALILGFNFLKGRSLVKTGHFLYARFDSTFELAPSHPVFIKGFKVGSVYEIAAADDSLSKFNIAFKMNKEYAIPVGSVAVIKSNPLGSPSVTIYMSNNKTILKDGEFLETKSDEGLFAALAGSLNPITDSVKKTIENLNTVLTNVNSVFDPRNKANLQSMLNNMNNVTASLMITSASLQAMLNQQKGSLAKSLNNVESFSSNLKNSNAGITQTLKNVEELSTQLKNTNIDETMTVLRNTVGQLNEMMKKVNDGNGTLGQLMNDKKLYNNLNATMYNANLLLQDFRVHPKRYVSFSVFGKKDKSGPLMQPLTDSMVEIK